MHLFRLFLFKLFLLLMSVLKLLFDCLLLLYVSVQTNTTFIISPLQAFLCFIKLESLIPLLIKFQVNFNLFILQDEEIVLTPYIFLRQKLIDVTVKKKHQTI